MVRVVMPMMCRGRTAHESIFNVNDGNFRCPNSQQGYSGLPPGQEALHGPCADLLKNLNGLIPLKKQILEALDGRKIFCRLCLKQPELSVISILKIAPTDGVPYWDTGAPDLYKLGDYLNKPADPFNDFEPVDSSAAAIAAQGLLRLGRYLQQNGETEAGDRYWQAGLTVLNTILDEPYLSTDPTHQGLLLHSVYHRPNGWDYIPPGSKIPNGESSMWGDYHAREVALYIATDD